MWAKPSRKRAKPKPKPLRMWAVMVNDEMYGDSLSHEREGAASYLPDARHAAGIDANVLNRAPAHVRVVKVTIEDA